MSSCFHNKIAHSLALKKKRNCSGFWDTRTEPEPSSKPAKGNVYMLGVLGLLLHREEQRCVWFDQGEQRSKTSTGFESAKRVGSQCAPEGKNRQSG